MLALDRSPIRHYPARPPGRLLHRPVRPKPLKQMRYDAGVMTVCIAAACENGKTIVTATDGLLSTEEASGESVVAKMLWYGPWQFMYAGDPAHFAMVKEEIAHAISSDAEAFSRSNVLTTVRAAYRKVNSRFASFDSLNPFDMSMEEFKKGGLKVFGEKAHGDLFQAIRYKSGTFDVQVLVTGWGHAPSSCMIYEVGQSQDRLHDASGFATIGSGAFMAQTTLLLMKQGRHRTLADTIFNVACAKFASERSSGVGKMTTMYVSRKNEADLREQVGKFIPDRDVGKLRVLWNTHLKPRIPGEARGVMGEIAAGVNDGQISPRDMVAHIEAMRMGNKRP